MVNPYQQNVQQINYCYNSVIEALKGNNTRLDNNGGKISHEKGKPEWESKTKN